MSAAAEEKSESAAAGSHGESSGGGGGKLVMILTIVNILVTAAMVAVLFISFQKEAKKPAATDIVTETEEAHGGGHGEAKKGEHGEAKGGHGGHGGGEKKKTAEFGRMVTLEQFTVNLSTPGSATPKFVRVNVSIEVQNEDAEAEVNSKMPQVRNTIIDLFNSKRPSDLATADGRDYLKEEIKNALNGFLVHGKVQGVFFTNFALSS